MSNIPSESIRQQLELVRQVAQKPTRLLSTETLQLVEESTREGLQEISTPKSIYYTDRTNGNFTLDFKAQAQLSGGEKEDICILMNYYRYDPSLSLDEQSRRGFLGNGGYKLNPDYLTEPPHRSDWLLVKDQGKVIAFMNVNPFDKDTPEELSKCLAKALVRRPLSGRGFLRSASVVNSEYKGRNLFRLMLEAL